MNTHAFNGFARAGATAALLLLAGCDASGDQANNQMMPAPEVDIAVAQPRDVTLWDSFTGRMAAPETVALRARVSGYIDKVAFEEGELVKQGDVLFVIDQRPYQARLQMARAEVARARSQVTLAAREARRAEQLWERRAISREEMGPLKNGLMKRTGIKSLRRKRNFMSSYRLRFLKSWGRR